MTTTKSRSSDQSSQSALRDPKVRQPEHEERLLDSAIAESFPASDPISPAYGSSLEPVLLENDRSRDKWKRRMRTATPPLIALGSVAVIALMAAYLLRDERSGWRNLRSLRDWRDWRDYLPGRD